MILECEKCKTRFLIDAAILGLAGRTVRCASCGHSWHAYGESSASGPQVADALPNIPEFKPSGPSFASLPAVKTAPGFPVGLAACALVAFVAAVITAIYVFRAPLQVALPGLAPVYDLLGVQRTDGLVFADITHRKLPSRTKARFIVEGKIINEAEAPREIPTVRVSLADEKGEVFLSRDFEVERTLAPGEVFEFRAERLDTSFVDRAAQIVVDMGSPIELMVRE